MPCHKLPALTANRANSKEKISSNLVNDELRMGRTLSKCRGGVKKLSRTLFALLFTLQGVGRGKRPGARDGQNVGILGDVRRQRRVGRGKFDDAHRRRIEQALA